MDTVDNVPGETVYFAATLSEVTGVDLRLGPRTARRSVPPQHVGGDGARGGGLKAGLGMVGRVAMDLAQVATPLDRFSSPIEAALDLGFLAEEAAHNLGEQFRPHERSAATTLPPVQPWPDEFPDGAVLKACGDDDEYRIEPEQLNALSQLLQPGAPAKACPPYGEPLLFNGWRFTLYQLEPAFAVRLASLRSGVVEPLVKTWVRTPAMLLDEMTAQAVTADDEANAVVGLFGLINLLHIANKGGRKVYCWQSTPPAQ